MAQFKKPTLICYSKLNFKPGPLSPGPLSLGHRARALARSSLPTGRYFKNKGGGGFSDLFGERKKCVTDLKTGSWRKKKLKVVGERKAKLQQI